MTNRALVLALIIAAVLILAARPVPTPQAIATGELHRTHMSVCEHPWYPGLYLLYYPTNGCFDELFLHGDLAPEMVGSGIWAQGILLRNGGCTILEITKFSLCKPIPPPEP